MAGKDIRKDIVWLVDSYKVSINPKGRMATYHEIRAFFEDEVVEHRIGEEDWNVTQEGRSVAVRRRGDKSLVDRFVPPAEWGENWGWNIHPDGRGIVFTRNQAGRGK